jgi:hypothetical protein
MGLAKLTCCAMSAIIFGLVEVAQPQPQPVKDPVHSVELGEYES